jgi:predicted transcriptional regulator
MEVLSRFYLNRSGLEKTLGPLEARIMEIIWQEQAVTPHTLWSELKEERDIAYSTVRTVMNRLVAKDLLQRQSKGRTFTYRPAVPRSEFRRRVAERVVDELLEGYGDSAIAYFLSCVERQKSAPSVNTSQAG